MGYRTELAGNGIDAIERLKPKIDEVVQMDLRMPKMDTQESSRRLIAKHSPQQLPHIVALAAKAAEVGREAWPGAGIKSCVSEPVPVDALDRALFTASPERHRRA